MNARARLIAVVLLVAVAVTVSLAQRRGGGRDFRQDFGFQDSRGGVPVWTNAPEFERDVFTFARIVYNSGGGRGFGRRGGDRWDTDLPDADLNFAFRLQQLTSLKAHSELKYFDLTNPELLDHPFIYIIEPGGLEFSDEEVKALRNYLLNGGFLMVDDFWGENEWQNLYEQMKRVFPDREPQELPLEHPIFHCVFDLKEKPQVPNYRTGEQSQYTGVTWERWDAQTPHYRALFDDKGRMMAIICHNTDTGDGWEREGVYEYYFREFSEKKAYPLGINIVFYAMTH